MFDKSTLFAEEISKKYQKEISHQAERNLQLPQRLCGTPRACAVYRQICAWQNHES